MPDMCIITVHHDSRIRDGGWKEISRPVYDSKGTSGERIKSSSFGRRFG